MSKLDELIKELCPDGVEYVPIEKVAKLQRGNRLTKNDLIDGEEFPVYSGGISEFGRYNKFNREANTITIAQYGTAGFVNFIKEKFWANDVCCSIIPNNIDNKFLYYCMMNLQNYFYKIRNEKATPYSIDLKLVGSTKIPLPPLPVQEEIVRILDKFTKLTAELTAELRNRKKQYDYYRDSLFKFKDGVNLVTLDKVTECIVDGTHQTPKYENFGIKFVSVENISNLYETSKYISIKDYEKYKVKPIIGDVLMTRIGTIGVCTVINREEDLAYYVTLALIRTNIKLNPYYLKYVLESRIGRKEIRKRTLINAVPIKVNLGDISKIKIPLPPLIEQQRIVDILDRFDTLCNDISKGLPAEIKMRQQQYEYYRDKLLSFKELEN